MHTKSQLSVHQAAYMITAQKAILPGILIASLFIIFVTQLIADPQTVFASASDQDNPQAEAVSQANGDGDQNDPAETVNEDQSGQCSLAAHIPDRVRQWCDLIEHYSIKNGLSPGLIAALITQESGGNANAYSHSGAVGLMQIMPRDGIATKFMCINGPCFHDRPSMEELYDPEFNIQWGTRFLAGLVARHGNLRDALKAYGPMDRGYQYADLVLSIYQSY
jgi:hypothetical protein